MDPRTRTLHAAAVVGACLFLIAPGRALGTPGELDPSFGQGGLATTGFGPRPEASTANDILKQADGKLVAVGGRASYGSSFTVARFTPDGAPDSSFGGGDGIVTTDIGGVSVANAVAEQPDGKIVVAGRAADDCHQLAPACAYHLAIARYATDGALDPTFGEGDGIVTVSLLGGVEDLAIQGNKLIVVTGNVVARFSLDGSLDPSFGDGDGIVSDPFAQTVAVQSDNKLVSAGLVTHSYCNRLFCSYSYESRVSRYLADGGPDATFGGGDGRVDDAGSGSPPAIGDIAIQPDGKIVVAGGTGTGGAGISRFNADGTFDQSFGGGDGVATFPSGGFPVTINAMGLSPAGSIVVAGGRYGQLGFNFALARVDSSGALDPAFGNNGLVSEDRRQPQNAILVGSDDSVVVAGDTGGVVFAGNFGGDFALSRYQADGSFDPGFGIDGFALSPLRGVSADQATSVALAPDGKIVAAGTTSRHCGPGLSGCQLDFGVSRFESDGSTDPSFGDEGHSATDLGGLAIALDAAVQPDGKILAAGQASDNCAGGLGFRYGCHFQIALVRYGLDGSLDPSFGNGGIVRSSALNGANALALQPDGRILVAGAAGDIAYAGCDHNCDTSFAIARFNPDGSLDGSFGDAGVAAVDLGDESPFTGDEAMDLVVLADGEIVAAGADIACQPSCIFHSVLLRFTPEGELDPTFANGGVAASDAPPGLDLALEPRSGDLLELTGQSLLRYHADGRLDENFGSVSLNGLTDRDNSSRQQNAHVYDVDVDGRGRIVVGGSSSLRGCGGPLRAPLLFEGCALLAARFNPDGSLDPSFGNGEGVATADLGQPQGERAAAGSIAIASDGNIVTAGTVYRPLQQEEFALARIQGGGPPVRRCHRTYASIVGTPQDDHLVGTPHRDVISGLGGDDSIASFAGNDLICGGAGQDRVRGGSGKDVLLGQLGLDRLFGGAGPDHLFGGGGNDLLAGGLGRDRLIGGAGKDQLRP